MLGNITAVDDIFIVCGRSDMRKSIDGLCSLEDTGLLVFLICFLWYNKHIKKGVENSGEQCKIFVSDE